MSDTTSMLSSGRQGHLRPPQLSLGHPGKLAVAGTLALLAIALLAIYLMPLGYAFVASLRVRNPPADAPIWPMSPATFTWEGREVEIFRVPTAEGERELAIIDKGRTASQFVNPQNPARGDRLARRLAHAPHASTSGTRNGRISLKYGRS